MVRKFHEGMCNAGPMSIFRADDSNKIVFHTTIPHNPMPDVRGYYVMKGIIYPEFVDYNPSISYHKGKELY